MYRGFVVDNGSHRVAGGREQWVADADEAFSHQPRLNLAEFSTMLRLAAPPIVSFFFFFFFFSFSFILINCYNIDGRSPSSFNLRELTYQCRVVRHIWRSLGPSKLTILNENAAIVRPIEAPGVSISTKLGVRKLGWSEKNSETSRVRMQLSTNFKLRQHGRPRQHPLVSLVSAPTPNLLKGLAQYTWRLIIRHRRWISKSLLLQL